MWKNNLKSQVMEIGIWLASMDHLMQLRRKASENLCALLESIQRPWICFGDFNIVLDSEEKHGGRPESSMSPNVLKDIFFELGAIDLGFSGSRFT